jgi:hypothetical protein
MARRHAFDALELFAKALDDNLLLANKLIDQHALAPALAFGHHDNRFLPRVHPLPGPLLPGSCNAGMHGNGGQQNPLLHHFNTPIRVKPLSSLYDQQESIR